MSCASYMLIFIQPGENVGDRNDQEMVMDMVWTTVECFISGLFIPFLHSQIFPIGSFSNKALIISQSLFENFKNKMVCAPAIT